MNAPHDASAATVPPWRTRLDRLVAARRATPFAWGVHDCCLWAADAVLMQTLRDPADDVRGRYSSAAEALRMLAQLGGLRALGARAGEPIEPLQACEGDVGLIELEDRSLLAVLVGGVWTMPSQHGLAARPMNQACAAWRVARG